LPEAFTALHELLTDSAEAVVIDDLYVNVAIPACGGTLSGMLLEQGQNRMEVLLIEKFLRALSLQKM